MKQPAVYMLASQRNGTLYIGVTSNLVQRVWQHREGLAEGFTKQYGVKTLVWYEQHVTMESAIGREKSMKKWLRKWKLATIEKTNPDWRDLWPEILGTETASIISAPPAIVPSSPAVVPANAGTQQPDDDLDSRIRGNDGVEA
jgi:putative endonuclease